VNTPGHELVRPFVMTGGRTEVRDATLRLETVVQRRNPEIPSDLPPEEEEILRLCAAPTSIAELGARLGLVIGVVMVLVDDLMAAELLDVHQTDPVEVELSMLTRMIERVRAI